MSTAPVTRGAPRETYAERLLKNIALSVSAIDDPRERLATQVGLLQGEIRKLLPEPSPTCVGRNSYFCEAQIDGLGDCTIHYDYTPGSPGRMYLSNGDPGYPDEPAELDLTVVQIGNCEFGTEVFSSEVHERLEAAVEHAIERSAEDAMAYRYEAREFA
jgi:hypothetical protein